MIDRTDIEIIEQLKNRGRASMRDIAEKIDIAPSTASTRFQRLKERSVIKGFKPVVDYEKLGFELTAVLEIQAKPNDIPELAKRLENRNQIISFFEVTGTTDMILICKFMDRDDLNQFVKHLQKTDGVSATETHIVLTSPKTHGEIDLEKVKD